jgi:hypothetical protein
MKLLVSKRNYICKRKYHIYGLASNYLKVAQFQLYEKDAMIKSQKEVMFSEGKYNQLPLGKFMKKAKASPLIKQMNELEMTIEACENIKRLCDEAYELGKQVREKKNIDGKSISDELFDFICLTNETYPCYVREDFEKIKMIYEKMKLI